MPKTATASTFNMMYVQMCLCLTVLTLIAESNFLSLLSEHLI